MIEIGLEGMKMNVRLKHGKGLSNNKLVQVFVDDRLVGCINEVCGLCIGCRADTLKEMPTKSTLDEAIKLLVESNLYDPADDATETDHD